MKKLIVLAAAISMAFAANAKSQRDLWIAMPDSLLPTFNRNIRLEFVELKDLGVKPEVKNLLGYDCLMDTLTADFLQVSTSQLSTLQIKRLPMDGEGKDSVVCVVKTFSAPEKESEVMFYDQEWHELNKSQYLAADVKNLNRYFIGKPDTMSIDKYEEMHRMVEPVMVSAEYVQNENVLTFSLSLPMLSKEEKEQLNTLVLQRKFKWVNGKFKEI